MNRIVPKPELLRKSWVCVTFMVDDVGVKHLPFRSVDSWRDSRKCLTHLGARAKHSRRNPMRNALSGGECLRPYSDTTILACTRRLGCRESGNGGEGVWYLLSCLPCAG